MHYTPRMLARRLLPTLACVGLAAAIPSVSLAQSTSPGAPARPAQPPQRGAQPGTQGAAPNAAMPPIEVTPKKAELGKVAPGSTTSAVFVLRNTGTAPLKVTGAVPSCKCTAITPVAGQTIAPGATLEISAALKAPPTPGDRDAKVFVSFEGFRAPVVLELIGEVVMDIVVEPAYVDALKGVTAGSVKVRSQDGKPFSILSAGGAAPKLRGFDAAKDAPRAEYELEWSVAGIQTLPIWWVVETDRPAASVIPLRVRNENTGSRWDMARFDRQWHVKDSIVFPGSITVGEPTEMTIEVEYYNPPPRPGQNARPNLPNWSKFSSIAVSDPTVKIEVVETKALSAEHFEIKVRITGSTAKLVVADCIITTETGTGILPFVAKVVAKTAASAGG